MTAKFYMHNNVCTNQILQSYSSKKQKKIHQAESQIEEYDKSK